MSAGERQGHLLALFTIIVWGTTFLSTSVLLDSFAPLEILIIRMLLGIAALTAARPRRLRLQSRRHEWLFAGAGLTGVVPVFPSGKLRPHLHLFGQLQRHHLHRAVFRCHRGAPVSARRADGPQLLRGLCGGHCRHRAAFLQRPVPAPQPLGDLLCLLAAVCWGGYSVFLKKIETYGYDTLLVTRRIFLYGLVFLLPALPFTPVHFDVQALLKPVNLLNLLYLGLCASALCFVTWNVAVSRLGAVRTSVYIYLSPVVTIISSWLLLSDPILPMALLGAALTLVGLLLSQRPRA